MQCSLGTSITNLTQDGADGELGLQISHNVVRSGNQYNLGTSTASLTQFGTTSIASLKTRLAETKLTISDKAPTVSVCLATVMCYCTHNNQFCTWN